MATGILCGAALAAASDFGCADSAIRATLNVVALCVRSRLHQESGAQRVKVLCAGRDPSVPGGGAALTRELPANSRTLYVEWCVWRRVG
jgi:hypothetical protein